MIFADFFDHTNHGEERKNDHKTGKLGIVGDVSQVLFHVGFVQFKLDPYGRHCQLFLTRFKIYRPLFLRVEEHLNTLGILCCIRGQARCKANIISVPVKLGQSHEIVLDLGPCKNIVE